MSDATCKTCPWYDDATPTSQSGTRGHCCVGPPRYSDHPQSNGAQGYWPEVHSCDWCGEHPERDRTLGSWLDRLESMGQTVVGTQNVRDHLLRARAKDGSESELCPSCGSQIPGVRGHRHLGLQLTHHHVVMGNHQGVQPCGDSWHGRAEEGGRDE